MDGKTFLNRKTHNPGFLQMMAMVILACGLAAALVTQFLPQAATDYSTLRGAIKAVIQQKVSPDSVADEALGNPGVENLLMILASVRQDPKPPILKLVERLASTQIITPESPELPVVIGLLQSLSSEQPHRTLLEMADESNAQPVRYANHALGVLWFRNREFHSAAVHFEVEGKHPEAEISRQFCIDSYQLAGNREAIVRLAQDPSYQPHLSATVRREIAMEQRDWGKIVGVIPPLLLERFGDGFSFFLAILAGLGWFVIAVQLGQPLTKKGARLWLCALAVASGPISIGLTHLLIIWQELDWPIRDSIELVDGFKYYVFGVGLREEVAKLIALLPLMPWIVRRKSTQEALIVSACAGLGFAIIENMGYFVGAGGTNSLGRFLTANFAHMAMTGVIGLAVARACWSPHEISHSLLVGVVVVLVHGFYDAAIVLPALAEYSVLGTVVFIGLAYVFFSELREVSTRRSETISQTATFLLVVCTLTSVTFAYTSWGFGFVDSLKLLVADVTSLGIIVYMYIREMPNSLIR